MKRLLDLLDRLIEDPRREKLILVLLPCLSLIIAGALLAPTFIGFIRVGLSYNELIPAESATEIAEEAAPSPAVAASPAPIASEAPQESPEPTPAPTVTPLIALSLSASSTEKDMYIKVHLEDGSVLKGHTLRLDVSYPDGASYSFDTEKDGSCYLVRLEPGKYTVKLSQQQGFAQAEPISCDVKARVEHQQIENLEELVEVKDSSQVSSSETKTVTSSAEAAEVIFTPAQPQPTAPPQPQQTEKPRLDSAGNQLYTYTVDVGANGFLLDKYTGLETDVLPIDENGDSLPEYGLRLVKDESGNNADYYVSVILYNPDNTPAEPYSITATPITDTVESAGSAGPAPSLAGWQTINGKQYYFAQSGERVSGLKNIDGKLYFFNDYGEKAASLGVDVSFYNGSIDWNAVKAQGIDFAIIRLGGRMWRTGELYDDECFSANLYAAKQAGLRVGVYFYSTAINSVEAVQEASLVLDRLGGVGLDMPVYFDTEYSGIYPEARSDNLSKAQRTEIIHAFCQTIQNGGYTPGVYSGQNFFQNNLDYSAISCYSIWLANYTYANRLPSFPHRYNIWQFTDSGQVNGISTAVDLNVIF